MVHKSCSHIRTVINAGLLDINNWNVDAITKHNKPIHSFITPGDDELMILSPILSSTGLCAWASNIPHTSPIVMP